MDPFLLIFKLVENIFLFLLDIIYIVIFATANHWSLRSYLNLGYVADAFIIVLLINASLRAIYLLYLKIRLFCSRNYRLDRAYNPASLGYDYRSPGAVEMALLPGPQKYGVPSRILINSNVDVIGANQVVPIPMTGNQMILNSGANGIGGMGLGVTNTGGFIVPQNQVMEMNMVQQPMIHPMGVNQITSIPMGVNMVNNLSAGHYNPVRSRTNIEII